MDTQYWAALPEQDLGKKLKAQVDGYAGPKAVNEIIGKLACAYRMFYGLNEMGEHATSGVLRAGEQGELAEVKVNHARALVQTLLNLITSAKVVWSTQAVNNDWDSVSQCIIGASLLENYWSTYQVAKYCIQGCEEAIAFTEGFLFVSWDPEAGDDYMPDTAPPPQVEGEMPVQPKMIKTGDVCYTNISSWDVIRDSRKKSWDQVDEIKIRLTKNKWDLAARYPDKKDQILKANIDYTSTLQSDPNTSIESEERDDITVYHWFHRRTPALPKGREAMFLPDGTILFLKDELEYDDLPVYRVAAAELIGTPYGYSPFLEIMGMQTLMDSLHSSVATNQTTFGTQNIAIQQGSEIPVDQIAGGMRAWYYPAGAELPKAIDLCRTPPETFVHLQSLKKDMEQLFGVNDVVRGSPEGSTRSGKALALLQSQALQQASSLQQDYIRFVESVGMATLRLLQTRATIERKVSITGKANRFLQREEPFTGASISKVKKVVVQVGNPLSQTAAGREQLADKFIQLNLIKTPEQLEQVLTTGRIEPLTQGLQHELMLILAEGEDIGKGVNPPVWLQDDALLHCREHRAVAANPEARRNPQVMQAFTQHIQDHYAAHFGVQDPLADPLYRPRMLFLMGLGPEPQPLPPPGMEPGPGGGGGKGGPPDDGGGKGGAVGPGAPPAPQANANEQTDPNFPTNPATGKVWNPTDGGGMIPS